MVKTMRKTITVLRKHLQVKRKNDRGLTLGGDSEAGFSKSNRKSKRK